MPQEIGPRARESARASMSDRQYTRVLTDDGASSSGNSGRGLRGLRDSPRAGSGAPADDGAAPPVDASVEVGTTRRVTAVGAVNAVIAAMAITDTEESRESRRIQQEVRRKLVAFRAARARSGIQRRDRALTWIHVGITASGYICAGFSLVALQLPRWSKLLEQPGSACVDDRRGYLGMVDFDCAHLLDTVYGNCDFEMASIPGTTWPPNTRSRDVCPQTCGDCEDAAAAAGAASPAVRPSPSEACGSWCAANGYATDECDCGVCGSSGDW